MSSSQLGDQSDQKFFGLNRALICVNFMSLRTGLLVLATLKGLEAIVTLSALIDYGVEVGNCGSSSSPWSKYFPIPGSSCTIDDFVIQTFGWFAGAWQGVAGNSSNYGGEAACTAVWFLVMIVQFTLLVYALKAHVRCGYLCAALYAIKGLWMFIAACIQLSTESSSANSIIMCGGVGWLICSLYFAWMICAASKSQKAKRDASNTGVVYQAEGATAGAIAYQPAEPRQRTRSPDNTAGAIAYQPAQPQNVVASQPPPAAPKRKPVPDSFLPHPDRWSSTKAEAPTSAPMRDPEDPIYEEV